MVENFDAFLAHNSFDKEIVRAVCSDLTDRGVKCWIDSEQIVGGDNIQSEIREGINKCSSAVIFVGKSGLGGFQGQLEVGTFIRLLTEKKLRVILVLLPGITEPPQELELISHHKYISLGKRGDHVAINEIYEGIRKGIDTLGQNEKGIPLKGLQSLSLLKRPQRISTEQEGDKTVKLCSIMDQIDSGRALLFVGSKFSEKSKNTLGKTLPGHKELACGICSLAGIDEDEDLDYATNFFLTKHDESELRKYLKQQLTVGSVPEDVYGFLKPNWLRIYTTNYDNMLEYISDRVRNTPLSFTSAWVQPNRELNIDTQCVHINGSIKQLSSGDLQKSFVLSGSSFSSLSFKDSYWYQTFKKDLDRCNIIVFAGCSFDDFRSAQTLFESDIYRAKAFFLLDEETSEKDKFLFERYGSLVLESPENFAQKLLSITRFDEETEFYTDSFTQYELDDSDCSEIPDIKISKFLTYGKLEQGYFEHANSTSQDKPFMIMRTCLSSITNKLTESGKVVIVHSEFGNGKTVLIRQVVSQLTLLGKNVFVLLDPEANYKLDIEKIIQHYDNLIFVIDGYSRSIDIVQHLIRKKQSSSFSLLVADRSNRNDYSQEIFSKRDVKFVEYNIDDLGDDECKDFVEILNVLAEWGELAGTSSIRKEEIIKRKYHRRISLVLLGLLESEQIKSAISEMLSSLFENPETKSTIFSICLLGVMDIPLRNNIISKVAQNEQIYDNSIIKDEHFLQLFGNCNVLLGREKSSIIMVHLLHSHFTPAYSTEKLLSIAKCFSEITDHGHIESVIFKELMKFSFVERVLPDGNKRKSLVNYYDLVKGRIPRLKSEPQYWLQYAMAKMTYKDLNSAKKFLDNAYNIAASKQNYVTPYLDTQMARWYLLKSIEEGEALESYNLFYKAHCLLKSLENNSYKFRQVQAYYKIYEQKFESFTKGQKRSFKGASRDMIEDIQRRTLPSHDRPIINECEKLLAKIVAHAI